MELVSAYVVVIGLVTFILMLLSKKSCTNLFIAGMVASFATIEILTKGSIGIVQNELGWKCDFSEWWRIFTCIWVPKDETYFIMNTIFIWMIGSLVEKRLGNVKFTLIMFGGELLGITQWTAFFGSSSLIACGNGIAIAAIMGAAMMMYPSLRIVMPKPIGDTQLQVWNVYTLWLLLSICFAFIWRDGVEVLPITMKLIIIVFFGGGVALIVDSDRFKHHRQSRSKEKHIDIQSLQVLCVTDSQKKLYQQMTEMQDPALKDVWAAAFVTKLTCPKCGKKYMVVNNRVVCMNGHFLRRA